jgi:glycosyltransferase involved in cell wall biosynthesis
VNSEASYRRVCRLIKKYGVEDKVTAIVNSPNNQEVKMGLLRKAKVFLHTSLFEPFGISIVEGMGAGCIPVVHDSGGPREFVPHNWRYKNVEEAVQKINQALCSWSPSMAKDMMSIAYLFERKRFQNEFSEILKSYLPKKGITDINY